MSGWNRRTTTRSADEGKKSRARRYRPGPRGWVGKGRGETIAVDAPSHWRGTTVQVCGLWPWTAGAGAPMVGVPMGRHQFTGATICCDVISWFQRAKLIGNPSGFMLSEPARGKSTTAQRMAIGLAGFGALPMILGDLKPDYVKMVRKLGGQVVELGHGRGFLNVLDPGEAEAAAERLMGDKRKQVLDELHFRRVQITEALITVQRGRAPTDGEDLLVNQAMRLLAERHDGVPVLADLLRLIREAPPELRQVALDRGDDNRYKDATADLEISLMGLIGGGRLGSTFSEQTSAPLRRDKPVVYDISSIDDSETDLQAAALLACWSSGFATVNIANLLADAGLEPRRHYFIILDELWRALRAGRGLVDRVDALTRLNRTKGVGQLMISHTMSDLDAIPSKEDRKKAAGFVERAGLVMLGGLAPREMPLLAQARKLSQREQDLLISWGDPGAWDARNNREESSPGVGKFLIKVGTRPGIPINVTLTEAERAIHNSNERWDAQSRITLTDDESAAVSV